ncbi:MAG: DUF3299 domain-containing protein [Pirellulaceae bacterium]
MATVMETEQVDSTEANRSFSSDGADVYQSVSRSAVASVILGVLGLVSFYFSFFVAFSVLGLVFAFLAVRAIKRFPDELQGRMLAMLGGGVCVVTMIAAPAFHTIVYLTEVPEGYERLDFALLTSAGEMDGPPADALQYDGMQVFIKGYIHPTSMDNVLAKKFVLVPDLGTCCFGSQPPLTHMIEVSLAGDQYATKSLRKQRLAGTLRINQNMKPVEGLNGVFYQLKADVLK